MKTKLRRISGDGGDYRMLFYWCPACKRAHGVRIREGAATERPSWEWDGNRETPTLSPSILEFWPADDGEPQKTICHHFVKAGRIEFCSDNPHAFNGQTAELQDFPENYGISGEEA